MLTNKRVNKVWINTFKCFSDDIKTYKEILFDTIKMKGLVFRIMGKVGPEPLFFVSPKPITSHLNDKRFLIVAGFHGDEPAPPWGLLLYMRLVDNLNNVTFVPIVNPTGFKFGNRLNFFGEHTNQGFCGGPDKISHEGKILQQNMPALIAAAHNGFMDMHEYATLDKFCLYTFGDYDMTNLKKIMEKNFKPVPDGYINTKINNAKAVGGVARDFFDGSLENYMYTEHIPKSVCTETPGQQDIDKRIETNKELIEAFINET